MLTFVEILKARVSIAEKVELRRWQNLGQAQIDVYEHLPP